MKRFFIPSLVILLALLLASCGGTASTTSTTTDAYVSPNLDTGYENALNARLQLTLGSLKLAETNTPISADQATTMLPLWLALQNMTRTGNSAQAEVNALLAQIEAAFTPEQLTAIRAMELSSADLQAWASANGISVGIGSGQPGSGQPGSGQGGGMSAEARATKQAAEGVTSGSGGNGLSTAILNVLISYLQNLAQ